MKLIIFFSISFVVTLFLRILFGYYVPVVPVFEVLLTPLTWICVVAGVLAGFFILIKAIKEFRRHKED